MDFLGIGLPELLVILVLTLLVVGPTRLPEMAAQLARLIRGVRQYSARISRDFNEALQELEQEYDEIKGEWKEIGQGLEETTRAVNEELRQRQLREVRERRPRLDRARASQDGTRPGGHRKGVNRWHRSLNGYASSS